jgi:hypothetical protein
MDTPEKRIAYINAMVTCANIELAGMIAENKQREIKGESMAYVEDDFKRIILTHGIHHNAVITYLNG